MGMQTNPHISSVHAATFEKAMRQVGTAAELKRLAERHGPFLLGNDRDRLREIYLKRAAVLREATNA